MEWVVVVDMSGEGQIPPAVQERLLRLQQLQETLQTVLSQKQQLDLEILEIDRALSELEKTSDDTVIYKSIGSLLIRADKAKVISELTERKELNSMRVSVLTKQEERLRSQIKELQEKLQKDLRPIT
jgi:prefoldin beta subunit